MTKPFRKSKEVMSRSGQGAQKPGRGVGGAVDAEKVLGGAAFLFIGIASVLPFCVERLVWAWSEVKWKGGQGKEWEGKGREERWTYGDERE
jgi:hypothetical protein